MISNVTIFQHVDIEDWSDWSDDCDAEAYLSLCWSCMPCCSVVVFQAPSHFTNLRACEVHPMIAPQCVVNITVLVLSSTIANVSAAIPR